MSLFKSKAVLARSTTHIYRPYGGIADVREVTDRAAHVRVLDFPSTLISDIIASELACPAFYAMVGSGRIYLGETNNLGRRLGEHAADPQKAFVQRVFVVRGAEGFRFTKDTAVYLQYTLTQAAKAGRALQVMAGCPPRLPELDPLDVPLLERILEDSKRLLFDAGLAAFEPSPFSGAHEQIAEIPASETVEADETGPMEIGVDLPRGGSEFELRYDDTLWAHGYPAGDRFVVAAGSDIRITTNPSASAVNRARRAALFDAGVLSPIPGASDRMRLTVDVALPSMAIAAAVACGAHVDSSKWRAIDPNQRPLMHL
ncbi:MULTISPECIES: hypothetical protein [Bradyrhizobium]|uniref:GIY-YIG nuclease family protein n=1 Tax=Bradyrhizobium vignae TaxID=1549949 RepID=A0ABS3ZYR1_9BRAD|nr:hypothetical protein [Bradyrhizobium vignae]MBP0113302.1 hypothetical protein [Bradyrhizobium vignae]